ncbi:flagellar hook-basal body complex protein [Rheinheimera tangshanensis]|uniref:Flagellar hook protein FlgE n=1 Tax=Rheinheimera tangshanensis TaxID=400153 RepID=A0A5C8M332_9GAMM|nr:flagellar hook-basal body complex protein [Rheinheimera tangshanensis]TXK82082.1 flagellar hook-basal body complex protein [Rheinheimera tangshanensis]GGM51939.1 flagellar hook protein FlgE [Rheinheimera tangshanensis]
MSMFSIGLSGLSSTQKALEVTSNNIANAGTAGYKTTSTEFSALYSGGQRNGVNVSATSENFEKAGNLVGTGQSLDLAITGKGFFIISENGRLAYTQAGQFKMDGSDRSIVTNNGDKLQGYGIDDQGNLVPGLLTDLKVEAGNIPAKASTNINFSLNLNSGSDVITLATYTAPATSATTDFDPTDGSSFNYSQSSEVYDSLGNSHTLTQYFMNAGGNEWDVVYYMDGKPLTASELGWTGKSPTPTMTSALDDKGTSVDGVGVVRMSFGTDGQLLPLNTPTVAPVTDNNVTDPDGLREVTINFSPAGADAMSIKLDLVKSTQFGSAFGLYENDPDGYTSGEFSGVAVAENGEVYATFSNGEVKLQGQIALANFANPQGLETANNTTWYASQKSGEALVGVPSEGSFGGILAGSYMGSNVDISKQLVDLMSFQQSYQANAKTISTADEMMQVLFNAV